MKKALLPLLFFCIYSLAAADAAWHVSDAEFRLVVESSRPAENGYLNFGDYAMPILLTQGIDVRDQAGNKIPFYLHQTLGLILGPAPESPRRYIYFGLSETASVDQWHKESGPVPPDHTIHTNIYNRGHRYQSSEEWLNMQINHLENRFQRSNAWMLKYLLRSLVHGLLSPRYSFLSQPVRDPLAEPVTVADWNTPLDREDYKCRRYSDRARRVNFFSERAAKESYADPYRFSQARVDWAWRRLYLSRKNIFSAVPRLRERAPDAPLNDFINIFKPPYRNPFFSGNQALFHIADEAIDSRRNLAAVLEGKLIVPADGEYEFRVEAAGSFLFYLGDDLKLHKYNEPVHQKYLKVSLSAGLQPLKLCFQRPSSSVLTLAWKPPGAEQFQVLTEADFAPAWPNRPIAMQDQVHADIPLIRQSGIYDIFIGKTETRLWRELAAVARPEADSPPQVTWLVNGVPVFIGPQTTLVTRHDDLFGVMTEHYPPTRYLWLRRERPDKPWFHSDIDLKLHLPDFIYDDEELQMFVELASALPVEARTILSVTPGRENPLFAGAEREIVIPPKRKAQEDRYAGDGIYKYAVPLKGSELKETLDVEFTVKVPELTVASSRLRFIPLNMLPPLRLDAYGNFRDETDALVLPVLHRPALSEIRSWELPVKIKNQIVPHRHMLLIADNFGGIDKELAAMMKTGNTGLTFLPWSRTGTPLNRMRHDLPGLAERIREARADFAVIIPAADDLAANTPLRSQTRQLAALLQLLRANKTIHTIYLATPLPQEGREAAEKALSQEIYKLARDYGAKTINLNHFLRHDNELNYTPQPESPGYRELLPAGNVPDICRHLIRETVR